MSEKNIVVKASTIEYDGLFNIKDFLSYIYGYASEKGYTKLEFRHEEIVKQKGKDLTLDLGFEKKISDYAKIMIKCDLLFTDISDKEAVIDKKKLIFQSGKITFNSAGVLITDYENRWEKRPVYVFTRSLFDRYIYKNYTDQFSDVLKEDTKNLRHEVKSFLNLYKFK